MTLKQLYKALGKLTTRPYVVRSEHWNHNHGGGRGKSHEVVVWVGWSEHNDKRYTLSVKGFGNYDLQSLYDRIVADSKRFPEVVRKEATT